MAENENKMSPEEAKEKIRLFIITGILSVVVLVIILVVVLVRRADHKKRLESFLAYLNNYCNENFGDNWYVDGEDHINVHFWVPGTALAVTVNPENMDAVRAKYEALAVKMNKSAWDYDLGYGVTLLLHNDLNTENILLLWINGKLWEGE